MSCDTPSQNGEQKSCCWENRTGQSLTSTTRAFIVDTGSVLNIMGDGTVVGRGRSTSLKLEYRSGGTILVEDDGELNLYSGKLTYEAVSGQNAGNGGVINTAGTVNVYGSIIADGHASNAAGNIFVTTSGYLPVNCLELRDASVTIDPAKLTDTLDTASYSYHNLFAGVLETNRMITNVTMTITDAAGNSQSVTGFAIRTSTDKTHAINKFYMTNFLTEDPVKMIGSIDPLALAVGNYRCTVEVVLSSGERFTARDFDFTVTENDKTSPPVFLPE